MDRQLKVRQFGPIKDGFVGDGGFLKFPKVSIFCGPQASGKSTVAKLYSTFVWIEKALQRGDFSAEYLGRYNHFRKICAYQNLHNFFTDETSLHYIGDSYTFVYQKGVFKSIEHVGALYTRPQVVYVPSERNLVSVAEQADKVRGLPDSLVTLIDEYYKACRAGMTDVLLPIEGLRFQYDKLNKIAKLKGDGYSVRLSEASSGLQSVVPLYIVVEYLSRIVNQEYPVKMSQKETERMASRVKELLSDDNLTPEQRRLLLDQTTDTRSQRLISIVEEPEQNLFPQSQNAILYWLLKTTYSQAESQLVATTHSPYIIDALALHIKSNSVRERLSDVQKSIFYPVDGLDVVVYECTSEGTIVELDKYEGMPSDQNLLNMALVQSNDMFNDLAELEG